MFWLPTLALSSECLASQARNDFFFHEHIRTTSRDPLMGTHGILRGVWRGRVEGGEGSATQRHRSYLLADYELVTYGYLHEVDRNQDHTEFYEPLQRITVTLDYVLSLRLALCRSHKFLASRVLQDTSTVGCKMTIRIQLCVPTSTHTIGQTDTHMQGGM
jgi:hypothetical protein